MPLRQDYLLPPGVIAEDRASLDAIRDIPDYTPSNLAYSVSSLSELDAALKSAQLEVERLRLAHNAARRRLIQLHWAFHTNVIGARGAIVSQFGPDSDQVQAVGLKRKSDYRRGKRPRRTPSA